jgi:16S rRNA (adenine1518-N6/adenine1519-N6)-dimethyltransferase
MRKKSDKSPVSAKKHLGQHFLRDLSIAQDIAEGLQYHNGYTKLLEIGPGTGVLTDFLIKNTTIDFKAIELDRESVAYLHTKYPDLRVIEGDFLHKDLNEMFDSQPFGIIGNFPYNISSQIFFKVLDYRDLVQEVVCMLQKEVAERLCSGPGKKDYGILSVFLQAYFTMEYLFTVQPHVFEPPPKVKSGVIRVKRNNVIEMGCNEILFRKVVKQAFSMRRKTLRNGLKPYGLPDEMMNLPFFDRRAEELGVDEYIQLTNDLEPYLVK